MFFCLSEIFPLEENRRGLVCKKGKGETYPLKGKEFKKGLCNFAKKKYAWLSCGDRDVATYHCTVTYCLRVTPIFGVGVFEDIVVYCNYRGFQYQFHTV